MVVDLPECQERLLGKHNTTWSVFFFLAETSPAVARRRLFFFEGREGFKTQSNCLPRTPLHSLPEMSVTFEATKGSYVTVVVSGGTAPFQGLIEHMTKELTSLASLTRDLTEDLMKIFTERGFSSSDTIETEIVRVVIETSRYMLLFCDTELKSTAEFDKKKTSDGNIITCRC